MKETVNEQTVNSAQTAGAEIKEQIGAMENSVSYGKFKDATALFNAYNSLEAEFTKRCQKVKELESALAAREVDKEYSPTESQVKEQTVKEITDEDKEQILKDYLKNVLYNQPKAIVLDGNGIGAKTPIARPKTLLDAGKLAKEILTKK